MCAAKTFVCGRGGNAEFAGGAFVCVCGRGGNAEFAGRAFVCVCGRGENAEFAGGAAALCSLKMATLFAKLD